MKKKLMCLALAAILLVMAVPAFASSDYHDPTFRANSIYRGYTFKKFAKSTSASTIFVRLDSVNYHDNGVKNYFYACAFDNSAENITKRGYMKVFVDSLTIDYPLLSNFKSLTYYNIKVYNAYYKESKNESYQMTMEAYTYVS